MRGSGEGKFRSGDTIRPGPDALGRRDESSRAKGVGYTRRGRANAEEIEQMSQSTPPSQSQLQPQASGIESAMQEHRLFPPPPEISRKAHLNSWQEYERLYRKSVDDPEQFWGE